MATRNYQYDYQQAWADYQDAVAGLYARPVTVMAERGEGDISPRPDLVDRAQAVVDRSVGLGEAAAQGLASPEADQRELAALQLVAAAATDLAIANDLVRLVEEDVDEGVRERGATLPSTLAELRVILNTPPAAGIRALMAAEQLDRAVSGPTDPHVARLELQQAVTAALHDIRDDVASLGQTAFIGLVETPLPQVKEAAGIVIHEIMSQVGASISGLLSKAASLVMQALDKLLKVLGQEAQGVARQKAAEWIDDLKSGTLFSTLLDKLYETNRIQQEVDQRITQTVSDIGATPFNTAHQQVTELATRFHKQQQTIALLLRGLGWARTWIMGLPPWGPLAFTAVHVVTIGYIVYAGGDYIDWFRTGSSERWNFVAGLRTIVSQSLRPADSVDGGEPDER